ncbi:MAG: N-acetylmuramoyl-L-alanine amidase [Armatimonadetes bacterium]|nr:N-acetylmuramoyl-L-alanine amidase [Armatimonadota bacterium]
MELSTLTPVDPSSEELVAWLTRTGYRRPLATVLHHTWKPTAASFQGRRTLEAIRRAHRQSVSDIMANLYAAPDGKVYTARPLSRANWAHALIRRRPAEAETWALAGGDPQWFNCYALGLEVVADFDREDPLGGGPAGRAFETAMMALTTVHRTFDLPAGRLFFHRDVEYKTCPGRLLDRAEVRVELARRLEAEMGEAIKVHLLPDDRLIDCRAELRGETVRCDLRPLAEALGTRVSYRPDHGKVYVRRTEAIAGPR